VLARIPQQNIVNGYDVAAINTHATPQWTRPGNKLSPRFVWGTSAVQQTYKTEMNKVPNIVTIRNTVRGTSTNGLESTTTGWRSRNVIEKYVSPSSVQTLIMYVSIQIRSGLATF
jgi:hypothetical protein